MTYLAVRGALTEAEADSVRISGVKSTTHPRLDIDIFSAEKKYEIRWSLYLRALAVLQEEGMNSNPFGYFQLAGLHGLPEQTWPINDGTKRDLIGYCEHGTRAFLPWHRVYLLAVEQAIVNQALILAGSDEYKAEAAKIRLPYWDWAKQKGASLPSIVKEARVSVRFSKDHQDYIDNPLYSYKFGTERISNFTETKRHPDKNGHSQPDLVETEIEKLQPWEAVYPMLTENREFSYLSTLGYAKANSLEGIHNGMHNAIGGPDGHMTDQSVSAFDPVFWLHHVNIDRYYALWQAMHPTAHYQPEHNSHGDPNTASFDPKDPKHEFNHHLAPFYTDKEGTPWNIAMIQRVSPAGSNITTFDRGYHYPETTLHTSKEATEDEVRGKVTKLYGPKGDNEFPDGAIALSSLPEIPEWAQSLPASAAIRHEWAIYYKIERYIVKPNYTLLFFFGHPGDNPAEWYASPYRVGSFYSFKRSLESCPNCRQQQAANTLMSGEVRVTDSLLKGLGSTKLDDVPDVEAWLKDKLTWRILEDDGTEHVPARREGDTTRKVPLGLAVGVKSCMVSYPPQSELETGRGYDLSEVVGLTFNWTHHRKVTEAQAFRGGVTPKTT